MNWCALFAHLFCWFNIIPLPLYIYCYQIMDIENVKKIIERKPNLSTALGMNFLTSSLRHPKIFVKEFSDFLMSCHQHCLGVNFLVQR